LSPVTFTVHSQVAFSCTFHAFLFLTEKKIIIKWCYLLFLHCIILYFNEPKWPLARLCAWWGGRG